MLDTPSSRGESRSTNANPRGLVEIRPTTRFIRSGRPNRWPRISTSWPDPTSERKRRLNDVRSSRGMRNTWRSSFTVAGWSTCSSINFNICSSENIRLSLFLSIIRAPGLTDPTNHPSLLSTSPVTAAVANILSIAGAREGTSADDRETARVQALVAAARAGDREAFADLVTLHQRVVYRTALAALGTREDAEDATQEAFVIA